MKKARSRRRVNPTAASLRALPPIDFSRFRVRRNPYAARLEREGIELVHDQPSAGSPAEIPEADLSSLRTRRNPYARRAAEALANMQYGKGRPPAGREVGETRTRSIRLPAAVWRALEAEAARTGSTVHAILRRAVTDHLVRTWRRSRPQAEPAVRADPQRTPPGRGRKHPAR